jgi:hypothetical protein
MAFDLMAFFVLKVQTVVVVMRKGKQRKNPPAPWTFSTR